MVNNQTPFPKPEPTVSLKEYTDSMIALEIKRVDDLRAAETRRTDDIRSASDLAVSVALQNVDKRRTEDNQELANWREVANHAKEQAKEQANTFLTKEAFEQSQRNQTTDKFAINSGGRQSISLVISIILGSTALISTLLNWVFQIQ